MWRLFIQPFLKGLELQRFKIKSNQSVWKKKKKGGGAREKASERGKESQLLGGATVLRAFELFSAFNSSRGCLQGMKKPCLDRHIPPPQHIGGGGAWGAGTQTRKPTTTCFTVQIFIYILRKTASMIESKAHSNNNKKNLTGILKKHSTLP